MNEFIFPLPRQCVQKQRQENHHLLMPFLANSVQWENFSRQIIRFHPIQNFRLTPLPIIPLPKEDFVLLAPSNLDCTVLNLYLHRRTLYPCTLQGKL